MSEVPNYDVLISLKVDFTLTNGVDPGEMPDFSGISSGSSLFADVRNYES